MPRHYEYKPVQKIATAEMPLNSIFTLFVGFAAVVGGDDFAGEQFLAVLLVAGEGLFNDADGGVSGANFFDLDLLAFELLVVLEKAFKNQQSMPREIAGFEVFAEFGIVGGDGDDFVVGGAGVHHGHDADGAGFDEGERLNGFLAQNEDIEGIVVFGVGLRDESVISGIEHRRVDDTIYFDEAGGLVEFVFEVGAERNFDDGLKVTGDLLAGRNVVPGMNHVSASRFSESSIIRQAVREWLVRDDAEVFDEDYIEVLRGR